MHEGKELSPYRYFHIYCPRSFWTLWISLVQLLPHCKNVKHMLVLTCRFIWRWSLLSSNFVQSYGPWLLQLQKSCKHISSHSFNRFPSNCVHILALILICMKGVNCCPASISRLMATEHIELWKSFKLNFFGTGWRNFTKKCTHHVTCLYSYKDFFMKEKILGLQVIY